MLYINGYDIEFSSGECVLIEFNIEPIDLGTLSGNIDGYFQCVKKVPSMFAYCGVNGNRVSETKMILREPNKFVLELNSSYTKTLLGHYFWGLRLTNGKNSVVPIINQKLLVRGLGHGHCKSLPITFK